jgi:hypothetical protein
MQVNQWLSALQTRTMQACCANSRVEPELVMNHSIGVSRPSNALTNGSAIHLNIINALLKQRVLSANTRL